MLTDYRKSVCLSLLSTDLPVLSVVDAAAKLSQKDHRRFHLVLTAPPLNTSQEAIAPTSPRSWWLEITPHRVIMSIQGNGQLSYRHIWEQGVNNVSRYWLPNTDLSQPNRSICVRNFTKKLTLDGHPLPKNLRVEYELWAEKVQLGSYILNLEIQH